MHIFIGVFLIIIGLRSIILGLVPQGHFLKKILYDPFNRSKSFHIVVGLIIIALGIYGLYLSSAA